MASPPISKERALQVIAAVEEALSRGHRPMNTPGTGPAAIAIAADALGISRSTIHSTMASIWRVHQMAPDWSKYRRQIIETPTQPTPVPILHAVEAIEPRATKQTSDSDIVAVLKRHGMTLDELSTLFELSRGVMLDRLDALAAGGTNVHQFGDKWSVEKTQAPAFASGDHTIYTSEADNSFRFGVMADSHLGSKYARMDALNDCYDQFAAAGITRVYHCGNWIEGEARFNKTDLAIHGMDNQLKFLAREYPQRPGITTYAVTGNDHEGWYAQREGIDIGRRAEQTFREAGRTDWVNLGYMEAHVRLKNANSGKEAILAVVHPGGGSSYAESYVVQKIIESLDGGEKPAVALYGHYHKCLAGNYRNVWWVLVPSTKDQDVFMRNKRIRSVVGGGIVTVRQDPATGAIIRCLPDMWQYFNRGYYNDRWSHSGDVVLPERGIVQ